MSRTIRRKNESWDNYCVYDWVLVSIGNNYNYIRAYYAKGTKEHKKGMAKYHSDKLMTMQQVPKWYKEKYCRRPFRRKEKAAIHLAIKYPEDDIVFPKLVKEALYYW